MDIFCFSLPYFPFRPPNSSQKHKEKPMLSLGIPLKLKNKLFCKMWIEGAPVRIETPVKGTILLCPIQL